MQALIPVGETINTNLKGIDCTLKILEHKLINYNLFEKSRKDYKKTSQGKINGYKVQIFQNKISIGFMDIPINQL